MTGNQFRLRADECYRAANSITDPERKLAQFDLAERWLRLATQLDEMDAKTQHDTPQSHCRPETKPNKTNTRTTAQPRFPASRLLCKSDATGRRI
jgi:hypothetical protein